MKKKSSVKKLADNIDGGASTQANYQFQYGCGAIIAINMYAKKFDFKELFCEIFEDLLGIKPNNHIVGIQIKFRDSKRGPFPITSDEILKTIKRFVYLNDEFPERCDKFIFMSNMPINFAKDRNLELLTNQCFNKNLEEDVEKIIHKLSEKLDIESDKLIEVFSKTEYQTVPDKEHLKDTIVNKHLSTIDECKKLHSSKLNDIADSLIDMIETKSTLIKNSLELYSSFLENIDKDNQIVNSKRITFEDIEKCIKKHNSLLYLDSIVPEKLSIGSYGLIDRKMNLGKINSSEIENMKILTHSAESYFLERYYEEEDSHEISKTLDDVQKKLHTIQAESETEASLKNGPMGPWKLKLIEERLSKEQSEDSAKFHHIQYEHLKGILGIMMTNCQVPFSEKPKGGWI